LLGSGSISVEIMTDLDLDLGGPKTYGSESGSGSRSGSTTLVYTILGHSNFTSFFLLTVLIAFCELSKYNVRLPLAMQRLSVR
jgi:hypothetical protein